MKNLLQSLFIGTFLVFFAQAQALEFETIKTKDTPGFFRVLILESDKNAPSVCSDILVIKNFTSKKTTSYESLIKSINPNSPLCESDLNFGTTKTLQQKQPSSLTDVIVLGDSIKNYPNFSLETHSKKDFAEFLATNVHPRSIYSNQIIIQGDENVSDLQINQTEVNDQNLLIVIGKFAKNIPTNLTLQRKSATSPLPTLVNIPVALDNIELANDPEALDLANAWADFNNKNKPATEKKQNHLPIILFSIGAFIILIVWMLSYFGGKQQSKQSKKQKNTFLKDAPETITTDPTIEFDSLPFEIQFPKEK